MLLVFFGYTNAFIFDSFTLTLFSEALNVGFQPDVAVLARVLDGIG
jgi:hypothetical protein